MSDELDERVARLEQRVARLEDGPSGTPSQTEGDAVPEGRLWAVEGLRERTEGAGAVLFAGVVKLADGGHFEWQWGRDTDELLDENWPGAAEIVSALAHPVRLLLLREVLHGTHTSAELADLEQLGTSGQVYHHLRQLVSAGWLRQRGRGDYAVPGERVVPLLVVLSAALS